MFEHRPSPDHAKYMALMPDYTERCRRQEEALVNSGFAADGLTEFLVEKYFVAYQQRSTVLLRECLTDDLVYNDPTTGSVDWYADQMCYDLCALAYRLIPDLAFYPQDDTPRALPYFDVHGDVARMTVPWRGIGRMRFTPRPFDFVGVDRYIMRREDGEWRIERADWHADLLTLIGQLLPIPLRVPSQATVERVFGAAQRVLPTLRSPSVYPRPQVSAAATPSGRRRQPKRARVA